MKGKSVPGLEEIIPSRSDYKKLVSYRTYRLANLSNRYNAAVTGKMSTYLKRVKHAISPDDRFNGDEPIEILAFMRTFKEAADHKELSEAAAAGLIPYFLAGAAKEGYRAHLDEAPPVFPTYPYMIQYLLDTYALDDELSQAYIAVTTAKLAEKETEKAFGRRLNRLAIRAGNVIDKQDLTTIYVEGLPTFVQAGLRMHLTPGMTFEVVQRLAHNLGVSLRQAVAQPLTSSVVRRQPSGVKSLLPRPASVLAIDPKNRRRLDPRPLIRKPGVIRRRRPIWPLLRPHLVLTGVLRVLIPRGDKRNPVPHPQAWSPYPRVGGLAQVVRYFPNTP
jgi:hypothetical protein